MSALPTDDPGTRRSARQDRELLAAIARGEMGAFERLTRAYHARLRSFLQRLIRRSDIADEALNDTLFAIWKGAGRYKGDAQPSTWIFGIAYRQGLNALRRSRRWWRRHARFEGREAEVGRIEAPDDREELRQWLDAALAGLPPEQRAVVELTYAMDLSYPEIAQIMRCPVGTVKTRMYHARRRLRPILEALAHPDPGGNGDPCDD